MFENTTARLALVFFLLLVVGCLSTPTAIEGDTGFDVEIDVTQAPSCEEKFREWSDDWEEKASLSYQKAWNSEHGNAPNEPVTRCVDALHVQEGKGVWGPSKHCPDCQICVWSEWQDPSTPETNFGSCKSIQQFDCNVCQAGGSWNTGPMPWCDGKCQLMD